LQTLLHQPVLTECLQWTYMQLRFKDFLTYLLIIF
jgi:hypothetical protein